MDNIWQKDKNNKMSSGEDFQPDPRRTGKIIWERDEDNGWETRSAKARPVGNRAPGRRVESGWNYDRYYHPGWGSNLKKIITNKFLVQTVVSLLIFVVALGIYDRQDPGSRVASRMVQYLLNVDVNFEPVLGRIVKLVFPELTDSPITPGGGVMPATTDPAATPGGGQANSAPQGSDTVTNPVLGTPAATDPLGTPSTAAGTGQKMAIPVNGTVIKKFGWVEDSVTGIKRYHEGIDIKAPAITSGMSSPRWAL
ncbi:MAG TPA: hypothetical protein VHS59_01390 [Bacillota bacterium]|nr:hypothetical protein [Bacillota bacterium]